MKEEEGDIKEDVKEVRFGEKERERERERRERERRERGDRSFVTHFANSRRSSTAASPSSLSLVRTTSPWPSRSYTVSGAP